MPSKIIINPIIKLLELKMWFIGYYCQDTPQEKHLLKLIERNLNSIEAIITRYNATKQP